MAFGLRGLEDLVEKIYSGDEKEIDEAAQLLTVMGKDPETIMPVVGALSRNPQIWQYDFEGNMEGQNLQASAPPADTTPTPDAETQTVLARLAAQAQVGNQALAEYLRQDAAAGMPKQPIQYAGGATVGSASPAGAPTTALYPQQQQTAPLSLSSLLSGVTNG